MLKARCGLPLSGLVLAMVVCTVPALAQSGRPAAESMSTTVDLSGKWQLNRDQSDKPQDRMRGMMGDRGGPGGAGGGFPGGAQRGDSPRAGGEGQEGQRPRGRMMMPETLDISQHDNTVEVVESGAGGGSRTRSFVANGEAVESDNGRGKSQTSAQWEGKSLVVTTVRERGGRSTETYNLSEDGNQLFVTVKIESDRMPEPISFRRVYDKTK
jgi:hypothetical protein